MLLGTTAYADAVITPPAAETDINAEPKVTLYTELNNVVLDIKKDEYNARYYRYFTSYDMPQDLQDKAGALLSFCVHSVSSGYIIKKPKQLSPTLWRVDIRDYNWDEQAIENVAQIHPYLAIDFMTPEYQERYNYMKEKSGNSLFRLDWFVIHVLDPTRQKDYDIKTLAYYELLYAKSEIPKNIEEFYKIWSIDLKKNDFLLKGTVVDGGDSIVSNHTRQLMRKNTEIGPYWETFDHPDFDYVEKLEREKAKRKAGEGIGVNYVGMQVYYLFNGETGNRVEFADNTLVRDGTHPTGRGNRVITPISCIFCHSEGINPATNKIREIIAGKVNLLAEKDYQTAQRLEAFYLDDLNAKIKADSAAYKENLKKVTGMETKDFDEALRNLHIFYDNRITLEQAAVECGVSIKTLREKANKTVSGRLGALLDGVTMPRDRWDRLGPDGKYGLAMIFVHSLDQKREFIDANAVTAVSVPVPAKSDLPKQETKPVESGIDKKPGWFKVKTDVAEILDKNSKVIGKVLQGEQLEPNKELPSNNQTIGVYYDGNPAWIRKTDIE